MMTFAALFFAWIASPIVQDAPAIPNEGWKDLDRVVVIVNEDIFTYRALQQQLVKIKNKHGLEGKNALQEAQSEILTESVKERLWVQGGQDLGVDPEQVQRMVRDHLERLEERYDGVVGLAAFLKSIDVDPNQAREELQENVYRDVYLDYITGDSPTAIGRTSRDTFVRPGLCRFHFRNALSKSRNLAQIGGKAQEVVLQFLIVDPKHFASVEEGRTLAEQLRERILDGEDMGDLNEQYGGAKRNRGVTEPFDESRLAQVDPSLVPFVRDAQPGDVSIVMEYRNENVSTWRLVRLVDRTPAVIPEFASPEVQKALLNTLRDGRREYRRDMAFRRLIKGSYVWPPELAGN
jgi:hypothetical protein